MRKLLAFLAFALLSVASQAEPPLPVLIGATTTGAALKCVGVADIKAARTFQVTGSTSTGTGTAVVNVEGTMDGGANRDVIGTVTLTLGTASTSNGFTSADRYSQVCGNVTTLSGTGASVNIRMGY